MSRDGQLVYANDASQPLLNFWEQEKGNVIPDEVQREIRAVFETDSKKVIEIEYEGKTLSCTLVPIRDTGYVNFYGSDITERRQISRQLRQSYAELQDQMNEMNTLLDILPIGVWIGNEDCSVITGNPAAKRVREHVRASFASRPPASPQTKKQRDQRFVCKKPAMHNQVACFAWLHERRPYNNECQMTICSCTGCANILLLVPSPGPFWNANRRNRRPHLSGIS